MEFIFLLLTVLGLSLFEIITSIDNAIINAEVLAGTSKRARRWFLTWGFLFAVLVIRGFLPLAVLWIANPEIGFWGALSAAFNNNISILDAITKSSPLLLTAGGIFLIFIFLNWLFLEPKYYGLFGERFFQRQGGWFFAFVSIFLSMIVWFALKINSLMAFAAVLGSTAFFITHGFRQYAQEQEKQLVKGKNALSDIAKVAYLEVLDASFSIDGVIGAFAFTFAVPLILLGNGLGALVLRQLTVSNIERIKRYKYLKNGAMYSIFFLGAIMLLEGFGYEVPVWLSPIITFITVGYFWNKSKVQMADVEKSLTPKKNS